MYLLAGVVVLPVLWMIFRKNTRRLASLQQCLNEEFDYIVVGAGTSGCTVASRLSEDANTRVLLIEAGADNSQHLFVKIPALFSFQMKSKMDWNFMTLPQKKTLQRVHYWPRAKNVGGCSNMNATLYVRGNKQDFDDWEGKYGCKGWNFDAVLPYFKKSERCLIVKETDAKYHGTNGPIAVSRATKGDPLPLSKLFVAACHALGIGQGPRGTNTYKDAGGDVQFDGMGPDYNGDNQFVTSIAQVNVENGTRCGANVGYIDPFIDTSSPRHRPNLHVLAGAQVGKIVFEHQGQELRAVGVEIFQEHKNTTRSVGVIRCKKEVILSAGALGSPHILLNSGIGPKEELEQLGVTCLKNVPGVGKNLQDHLEVNVDTVDLSGTTYHSGLSCAVPALAEYATMGKGALSVSAVEAVGFYNTESYLKSFQNDKKTPSPIMQLHWIPATMDKNLVEQLNIVSARGEPMNNFNPTEYSKESFSSGLQKWVDEFGKVRMCILLATLLKPKSRGSVTLKSSNPLELPIVDPNYLDHPDDMEELVNGVEVNRKIMDKIKEMQPGILGDEIVFDVLIQEGQRVTGKPVNELIHDRDFIREMVKLKAATLYHPVGTCRMGPIQDNTTVVDPTLKLKHTLNVRVVDASIMPEIVAGNTNAACYMIGEKAADMIKMAA